jgi:hypothetical protein
MNNTTVALVAASDVAEAPVYVVSYETARQFLFAFAIAGIGVVAALMAIAAVLVLLASRLAKAIGELRAESATASRSGLLNGDKSEEDDVTGKKKKKRGEQDSGTSCADEEDDFD